MTVSIAEFKEDLWNQIKTKADADGEGSTVAFLKIFSDYLLVGDVISSECIPTFYKGTGKHNRSLRIDGYIYDESDSTMTLVILDYVDQQERNVLTRTEAEKIFDRVHYFIEEALDGNLDLEESNPISDLVDYLTSRGNRENITKYRILLLTNTIMSSRIKEIEAREIYGIPVEQQIYDISRVHDVVYSDSGKENISIDFRSIGGIPCIEAHGLNSNDYRSYLCVIPGDILADIYDKYGGRLLEENVRMFLTNKSGVNKKIRKTIQEEPEKFFAFNNGISVTVRNIEFEEHDGGHSILSTDDFQIINGGQTTASLSQARFKDKIDLSEIRVPMKLTWLIDTDPDKVNQLVRNISYSANSQNKVTDADFFSTHPYHLVMEYLSRKIKAPAVGGQQYQTYWYYERVRGQYIQEMARMRPSDKKAFMMNHPAHQKFDKNIISKVRNTWAMKPDVVSKGGMFNIKDFAESVSKTWDIEREKYNDNYYMESIALLIMFQRLDKEIPKLDWYQAGGYKANIVIYSLALFHKLILTQFKGKDLDLMKIWRLQEIPTVILKYLVSLAYIVYDTITDDDRPVENVTQWCKRTKCWDAVKSCYVQLGADLQEYLV